MREDGLIELPNGSHIFYEDANHSYWRARQEALPMSPGPTRYKWRRSTRLTGASTLCKPYSFDPGRLLNWKERVTCEGIAHLYNKAWDGHEPAEGKLDLTWLTDGEVIRARLKAAGQDADSVRDRKADVGTRAHTVLEVLASGLIPFAEDGYGQAVLNWWNDRKPTVFNCEQFVYSETHGFAGRFDLRAKIPYSQGYDPVWLIDLKTSGWIAPSMHVQLALYELAAKECGVGESINQFILQVKDDGTYREVPCRATEQDALAAIEVYRGAARIERESGLPRAA